MAATRKASWMLDGDGAWACLLMSRPEAEALVSGIETGKEYEVTVKERRKRRSLDANAYFWVLCSKLAEKNQHAEARYIPMLYPRYRRELRNCLHPVTRA